MSMAPSAPGWIASARVARGTLQIETQAYSMTSEHGGSAVLPDAGGRLPGPTALQNALGVARVLEWGMFNAPKQLSGLSLQLPADVVNRSPARTGALNVEFIVDITKLQAASTMPLARGYFQDGAYSLALLEVRETPAGVRVQAQRTLVSTLFDPHVRPVYWYFVRNRRLGEAVRGNQHGGATSVAFAFGFGFSSASGGFAADAATIQFDRRDPMSPDAEMILTREWLDGAEFVIVRATHEGSVRRTLQIAELPLLRQ